MVTMNIYTPKEKNTLISVFPVREKGEFSIPQCIHTDLSLIKENGFNAYFSCEGKRKCIHSNKTNRLFIPINLSVKLYTLPLGMEKQ